MAEEFTNQSLYFGIEGIDLKRAIDLIKPTRLARMTNVVRTQEGALNSRPGTQAIQTAAVGDLHSVIRLNGTNSLGDPSSHYVCLLGGVTGSDIYWGDDAGLALVTFAGSDFCTLKDEFGVGLLPIAYIDSPNVNEQAWVAIPNPITGARNIPVSNEFPLNVKVRESDGAVSTLGRTVPFVDTGGIIITNQARTGAGTVLFGDSGLIDDCESAAGWTNNAGTGGVPAVATDNVNFRAGTKSLKFTSNPGGAGGAYYNNWNKGTAIQLNVFGTGTAITDDDIIHLWIRTDRPDLIVEFRFYFVVTPAFDVTAVPGTNVLLNTDAYYKSIRPSDFTPLYEVATGTLPTVSTAVATAASTSQLGVTPDDRPSVEAILQQQEPSRRDSFAMGGGRGAWQEMGIIGFPLRRGDFARIGTNSQYNWGNIAPSPGVQGFVCVAQINTNAVVNIWLDDIYVTGGYGLDSSPVGATPYDWRCTNFDPRTGEEGNPSDIQEPQNLAVGPGQFVTAKDGLRAKASVTPAIPYGLEGGVIRQRFYRRGGTLGNNWYYVGVNTADGGTFVDPLSDLEIVAAPTLDIDNDAPAQLRSIWGPVNGILFGCRGNNAGFDNGAGKSPPNDGDGGTLFWSKVDKPGSWPASYTYEVCSVSEELIGGFAAGGQSWVFSRERLFSIIPDLSNAAIMNVVPTQCKRGPLYSTAFCATQGGVFFVAKDGIYFSPGPGGPEQSITDDTLYSVFHGERKNGYSPIDFLQPEAIRLVAYENEIHFIYTTAGIEGIPSIRQEFIYNLPFQFWRANTYTELVGDDISTLTAEVGPEISGGRLLVGTSKLGILGYQSATSKYAGDFGIFNSPAIRTGALDQGVPRVNKLYGDAFIDLDRADENILITPYVNNEETVLPATIISTGSGRTRYYIPIDAVLARNISLDITWDRSQSPLNLLGPIIYQGGVSFTPQPDTSELRVTNWDTQGRLSDKWVKGVLMECDTGGIDKGIDIYADGAAQQSIVVNASGRQVLQFSFVQFRGRILRLTPTDTTQWMLYDFRWIFDEEPLSLSRWESQEIDHGFHGQQVPLFGHICIRSVSDVTLTMIAYRQDGTSVTKPYTLPSTAGAKTKLFVPFDATRGVLFKYTFTSEDQPFWLYREESIIRIQPWGQGGFLELAPFGDDDLDTPIRGMQDAGIAAARSGSGHR